MAKTYYAEGRQVAYVLRGLFILGGLGIYFSIPGLHWGFFFGILFGSVILGEIFGRMWTSKRRKDKKVKKSGRTSGVRQVSTTKAKSRANNTSAKAPMKKLTDAQLLKQT